MSIAYFNHDRSPFDRGIGATDRESLNADLLYELTDHLAVGAGHRYTILNVDVLEPQTNGHLHTFFLALHRRVQSDRRSFRFSIAPALSASSNVFADPGEYNGDTFQFLVAVDWSRQLSNRLNLRYGICGDHRFGRFAVYPSFSIGWRPHANWAIELGLPDSKITYRASESLSLSLRTAPDGEEWHVRDKSLAMQSQVIYEALLLEWAIDWTVQEHLVITASVGRHFDNRYEMTLMDNSRVRLRSEPLTRTGMALAWRF